MSRLSELKEKKKLDNNGFSLVELIIVIAIMAVLIGVLAPQYLKYVEKSRRSADLDNYQAIITAVQVYYSDVDNTLPAAGTYTIEFAGGKVATGAATQITDACEDAGVNLSQITMKSSTYAAAKLNFVIDSTGKSKFTVTGNTDLADALALN